jgi:SAM-dependent methyltransferase
MIRTLKQYVPWWGKLGSKLVLARVPLTYAIWRHIGLFEHGAMLDGDYARGVFESHFQHVRATWTAGQTILELGPGDSLATALFGKAREAGRIWLVDTGAWASRDVSAYQRITMSGRNEGPRNDQPQNDEPRNDALTPPRFESLEQLLTWSGSTYLVEGLRSLARIPDASVQLSFSHAVLEHVRRHEFDATIGELYRVAAPGGVSSHQIDLRDHLAESLNSLRFSRERWESPLFADSGFYTNRLRKPQILESFRAAGFEILSLKDHRWPAVPVPKHKLDREFAGMKDEDLAVHGLTLVARKPA